MIYLDNAATTPVFPSAAAAAMDAMTENYGNPSSIHKAGQAAKRVLYDARKTLAPLA
ncbi:MAG: aminotransferase class V-fold PLP-dependent enzyme, partial [Clostridia bacterium]|nr:aminotransferase class V-fold PLP-dependent enzyme [Clostridia bacterium]